MHTKAVQRRKAKVPKLPILALPDDQKYKIIESDAFDIGWGAVLKQKNGDKEEVIQFASGVWNEAQSKYPTIRKSWLLSRPFSNSRCIF